MIPEITVISLSIVSVVLTAVIYYIDGPDLR